MIIIGAGLAGLLAANRLHQYNPSILEKQSSLPNNHGALLRFRTNDVGEAIGIPFKKVEVYKGVLNEDGLSITNNPTLRDYNAYSLKTTGNVITRSIVNIEKSVRYIAPTWVISMLSNRATIQYNVSIEDDYFKQYQRSPIISTIPMPVLMRALKYPEHPPRYFNTRTIWAVNCEILGADVYQTLYVPHNEYEPYRISITGNIMTLEFANKPDCNYTWIIEKYMRILFGEVLEHSKVTFKEQEYGKIIPIPEHERQRFILWATDNHNVYSLGRYATWRQILLDDVLKDIRIIQKFIDQRSDYNRAIHKHRSE
jgi:hypothetical protein